MWVLTSTYNLMLCFGAKRRKIVHFCYIKVVCVGSGEGGRYSSHGHIFLMIKVIFLFLTSHLFLLNVLQILSIFNVLHIFLSFHFRFLVCSKGQ